MISFPGVFASSLVVTLTYAEMSMGKSRFLTAKATATDTEARLTPSGKGATGRDEAEREETREG